MADKQQKSFEGRMLELLAQPQTAESAGRRLSPSWFAEDPCAVTGKAQSILEGFAQSGRAFRWSTDDGVLYRSAPPDDEPLVYLDRATTSAELAGNLAALYNVPESAAVQVARHWLHRMLAKGTIKRIEVKNSVVAHYVTAAFESNGAQPAKEESTMAKAATQRKPGGRKKSALANGSAQVIKYLEVIPVTFGGKVGIGKGVANIGLVISRDALPIAKAVELLCGRRLAGVLRIEANGDAPEQTHLFPDLRHEISGTFDVPSFRVFPDRYSTGISFATAEIDIRELGPFAKSSGNLYIQSAAELTTKAGPDDDDEPEDGTDEDEDEEEEGDDEED